MKKGRTNVNQLKTKVLEQMLVNASGKQKSVILRELEIRKVVVNF